MTSSARTLRQGLRAGIQKIFNSITVARLRKKKWNVAFLVRDYPEESRTVGPTHFNGKIGEDFLKPLREVGKKENLVLAFLNHYPAERFIWVGIRVEATKRSDAVSEARNRLEGLVDGASFFRDNDLPKVSNFAWVATARERDLHLVRHYQQIWVEWMNALEEGRASWKERNEELQKRINRFFSIAIELHSKSRTSLAIQIRHSIKMFRHGKQSGSWGVEYICKFCALEGLVCGDERYQKEKKLISRLVALFRDADEKFTQKIKKLWEYRSKAVHTARAFDAGTLKDGAPLGVHIQMIEHLFVGALIFAMDSLSDRVTVEDLWAKVDSYELPPFARKRAPQNGARVAVTNFEYPMPFSMPDGGKIFRKHLAQGLAAYNDLNRESPGTYGVGS